MPPIVATLLDEPVALARMRDAIGDRYAVVGAKSWSNLRELILREEVEACFVGRDPAFEVNTFREIRRLRKLHAHLAIVVYAHFGGREFDLFDLGTTGVDGVILAGQGDGLSVIQATFRRALVGALGRRVSSALSGRVPEPVVEALEWSIVNADRSPDAAALSRAVVLAPSRLDSYLHGRGLPTRSDLLRWGRLFQAAYWISVEECTIESIAYPLGYSSGASLARAFRTMTGLPPTEGLRRGGVSWLLDHFLREQGRAARPLTSGGRVTLHA